MKSAHQIGLCTLLATLSGGCTVEVGDGSIATMSSDVELTTPEKDDRYGYAVAMGDFDGDGKADLAASVPFQTIEGWSVPMEGGAVVIDYGGTRERQVFHQDTPGIEGSREFEDHFGDAIVAGDFNADGKDDLAIGVRDEALGSATHAGVVHVLYGSESGLTTAGSQMLYPGKDGLPGAAGGWDLFGQSLAAGDFNGDGKQDLAVGSYENAQGTVHVIPGSVSNRLRPSLARVLQVPGLDGYMGGVRMAAGRLNGDSRDDLAIGIPWAEVDGNAKAGTVWVFFGESGYVSQNNRQEINLATTGMVGAPTSDDFFGSAVSCGDYNGDGFDDLAMSASRNVNGQDGAGTVSIVFGSASGPTTASNYVLHQDSAGVSGTATVDGGFGRRLVTGKFNDDDIDDLAVSARLGLGGPTASGLVYVFNGAAVAGPKGGTSSVFSQDTEGVAETPEENDFFGSSLGAGDHNGDGRTDLVVGVPGEDRTVVDAGCVHILLGSSSGITGAGDLLFTE